MISSKYMIRPGLTSLIECGKEPFEVPEDQDRGVRQPPCAPILGVPGPCPEGFRKIESLLN